LTKRAKRDSFAQNVMGVINFDGYWIYALAGWEGSAHNGQVFNDAMLRGFPLFEGKYYLGGAGYDLHQYAMVPYRDLRYHLKEWKKANELTSNAKELFNLRRSSARNIVE
jgi:hypothetical protein